MQKDVTPPPSPERNDARNDNRQTASVTRASSTVVAIGTAEGGAEPVLQLLSTIPATSGIAYVIMCHSQEDGDALETQLADLPIKVVRDVKSGMMLQQDHLYVIASHYRVLHEGLLTVVEPSPGKCTMPIDAFFCSLACCTAVRRVGIILSGCGSDGALGLKALRHGGGLTMVQSAGEAHDPDMPKHAQHIATPHYVMSARDMSTVLMRYVSGQQTDPDLLDRTAVAEGVRAAPNVHLASNRAQSQLLAAAMHDMRQALQSIRLLQGVLEQQVVTSQARATLAKLGDASEQMNDLVDSLSDLHSLESDHSRIVSQRLSIKSVFTQLANGFSPLAAAKALELRIVHNSGDIDGDTRLLPSILRHIVSDAIKHTDRGKILIGVRRRGHDIRFEIWNTGLATPANAVDTASDNAEVNDLGGRLRLGLHIAKRLAELLLYRLEVRSLPSKGTMIALVMPNANLRAFSQVQSANIVGMVQRTPRILLIENNPTQRAALGSLLQQQGYRVTEACSGAEAMNRVRASAESAPDLIVTDFNVQDGLFGAGLIRTARAEMNADIPAVILSSHPAEARRDAEGLNDIIVLPKPVQLPPLFAMIENMVARAMPAWRANGIMRHMLAEPPTRSEVVSEIAIVDDEPRVRAAVQSILDVDGYKVECFASAEGYLECADQAHFQCLIVAIELPGMSGLDLQARLKGGPRRPPIIFLASSGGVSLAVRAMREGAVDFLQKPVDVATLRESVARIMLNQTAVEPTQTQVAEIAGRLASLTKREREVMDRIVVGQLNKNIAADLNISERTTEHHRQSVMRKMGVKSLAMLVRMIAAAEQTNG